MPGRHRPSPPIAWPSSSASATTNRLAKLNNPVPDAKAIAASLKSHGFEVTEYYDLPRAELLDALEEFTSVADEASVALVYYAGHGLKMAGKNVLAPKDMEIDCEKKTPKRALDLDQLFAAVAGAPQQIVLLDACRNDPFPQCPKRSIGGGSGFRGFTRVGAEDRRCSSRTRPSEASSPPMAVRASTLPSPRRY